MQKKLLILNGLAILSVPIHHAAAYSLQAMFQWADRYQVVAVQNFDQLGSFPYYVLMSMRFLVGFAIPAFLFVSGYFVAFMARGSLGRVKWDSVMPRIRILLIPFALWTVIRYILLQRLPTSLDEILDPYYYITLIIQFYLLSPLIVPIARNRWKSLLLITAVIQMTVFSLRYLSIFGVVMPGQSMILNTLPRWFFLTQPFWFPFGIIAGLNLKQFGEKLAKIKWTLLIALVVFGLLTVVEYFVADSLVEERWLGPVFGGMFRQFYALALILCVLAFDDISFPLSKYISQLSPRTLGIYMANTPAIYVIASLFYKFVPWALGYHLLYWTVLFIAGLGGPLLLMEIVRRTPARSGYRFLFG